MKKSVKLWIFCALMTFLMIGSWCFEGIAQASVQQDFINKFSPDVIKIAHKYNLYPSVMMAQAALESSFGQSSLSQQANNYFGVKGSYNGQSITVPTMEYDQNNQPYYVDSEFKKYPSAKVSIEDNAQLIRNGIYGDPAIYRGAWRENAADGITAANALGGKYATDPSYASKLVNIIQEYNLNSLLDNTWKRLHIEKLKKQAIAYSRKIRKYRKRYSKAINHVRWHASMTEPHKDQFNRNRTQLIRYTKLYKNDQLILKRRYREYNLYDHLSRMDLDNWKRLGVNANRSVYTDLMGTKHGHQYYRIRVSPSQKHMYWVRADALKFDNPIYYYHPYQIATHEMNLDHAYSQILGTNNSVRVLPAYLHKRSYNAHEFAIVPSKYPENVWYRIRNDQGRLVWLDNNPKHGTQYLKYKGPKYLSAYHFSAPLMNHASDPDYRDRNYSWSRIKPRGNSVNVDHLAIDTHNNDSFWYRINNHHHTYWTNESAFK